MLTLGKYSIGIGDRFGLQGEAQLSALAEAARRGIVVSPVWNKSHREHTIVGTSPAAVREEADRAVGALGWSGAYYVDADHISRNSVGPFIPYCDYFTVDVADYIGKAPRDADACAAALAARCAGLQVAAGGGQAIKLTREAAQSAAARYYPAVKEAAVIFREIKDRKGEGAFVLELSMDETEEEQTAADLLVILAAAAEEGLPLQTIAPKFTGRFNKGVDYKGDAQRFARQFEDHVRVIAFAVKEFGLPSNLKLSLHSGSDKFSLYPLINTILKKHDAGLHLKTAGTTWLEELCGLAAAGEDGLEIAKAVYDEAASRYEELARPYATVIEIDRGKLPPAEKVASWSGQEFAAALRHDPKISAYNPNLRQLLHVAYKIAAEMGPRYREAVLRHRELVSAAVRGNILEKHIMPVFGEKRA